MRDRSRASVADRVVVTGLGAVSRLGVGIQETWHGLLRADARPTPAPETGDPGWRPAVYQVAEVPGPATGRDGRRLGRASRLAVHVAGQALADARMPAGAVPAAGVAVGTSLGDVDRWEAGEPGAGETDGAVPPYQLTAAVAGRYGMSGPTLTTSTACSASGYAVSWAADAIRFGLAEVMVVVGVEVHSRVALAALHRLGVLDPQRCRPFERDRAGMVTGEGAAALVLESGAHLARRNGAVGVGGADYAGHAGHAGYAEIEGHGWSCDGHHPTAPEPGGAQLVRALRAALDSAGVGPAELGAVLPHRAGIAVNDTVEDAALAAVLGDRATATPVLAVKAVLGHTAGAAGAFGCLTAALAVRHGVLPPNSPVADPDPDCALWVPQGSPARLASPHVLVSTTGFGGNNAALVIGRSAA